MSVNPVPYNPQFQIDFTPEGDTTAVAIFKHIQEFLRLYALLHGLDVKKLDANDFKNFLNEYFPEGFLDVANKVKSLSITTDKLADGAVTNDKIADGAITKEKLTSETAIMLNVSIGFILQMPSLAVPIGYLPLNGAEVNREDYPELWAFALNSGNIIADSAWNTRADTQSSVGAFSTGDGVTTFRLPKIEDFIRGLGSRAVGSWQEDAIRNIVGQIGTFEERNFIATGPFYRINWSGAGAGNNSGSHRVGFDVGRVVPVAEENRPRNIAYPWYIKAYN